MGCTKLLRQERDYFSWLEMLVNVALRLVPRVLTATMIATEMPAAIRPYSMAVAPLSSFRKCRTNFLIERAFIMKTYNGRADIGQ